MEALQEVSIEKMLAEFKFDIEQIDESQRTFSASGLNFSINS